MTETELAALIVAIASVVAVVLLAVALVSINRTLKAVRDAAEALRNETVPAMQDLRHAVRVANAELDRVDDVLGTAESIGGTLDAATRLAYLTFSNPVIKVLALASGTGRTARAFRDVRTRR